MFIVWPMRMTPRDSSSLLVRLANFRPSTSLSMKAALYSGMNSESSQSQTSTTVQPMRGFVRNSR